jgi:hypothetical protein
LTDQVFVVPPDWPQPPFGWTPPAGWTPDPLWPPAPTGWQFWQPRRPTPPAQLSEPPARPAGTLFGGARRKLEAEIAELEAALTRSRAENNRLSRERTALRAEVDRLTTAVDASNAELRRLLGTDPAVVRAEIIRLVKDREAASAAAKAARRELVAARQQLVAVQEMARESPASRQPRVRAVSAVD